MVPTTKLSREFYEQFGDKLVNELVELLNRVDASSKQELREQNELNFARFDAKLEQRLAQFEGKLEQRLAQFEGKLEQRLAEFAEQMTKRFGELENRLEERFEKRFEKRFAHIDARLDRLEQRLDQQNRLFMLAWVTVIAAVVGMGLR